MRMMLKFALLSRRAAPFVLAGMLCYTPLNTRAEGLTTGTAAIQPAPAQELLGPGVQFTRDVRQTPRPLVIAIVEVDLANPRLKFLATPGDPSAGRELRGMTTSNFLKRHKLRVAINGGFFDPFKSGGPLDFYPREGDAVDVFGLCAAQGQVLWHGAALFVQRDGDPMRVCFPGLSALARPLAGQQDAVRPQDQVFQDLAVAIEVPDPVGSFDRHPAGQGHVTLERQQRLHGSTRVIRWRCARAFRGRYL